MPKAGTDASLYLPDDSYSNAKVLDCVRKNGDSCAKTGNPSNRYFGTEHGSEVELTPTAVNVAGGSKEPLKLSFDDASGVTITSHKKLTLNAGEDISLYTPKRIVIKATSQLMAKKLAAQSGFAIEGEYHFLSENVLAEGRDQTAYPAYNDEPQKETPPPPPPPEQRQWRLRPSRISRAGKSVTLEIMRRMLFENPLSEPYPEPYSDHWAQAPRYWARWL
ncbi:hypothetical protein [Paenibacillus chitinolyticus]|uniref:hypothetical protein n=1 Tax=Paenibacillus chitinolyticus TaxID=79263 RepID=UPI000AD31DE6|nr:hypothetical protein [Paenibacillus chitinolyticus]